MTIPRVSQDVERDKGRSKWGMSEMVLTTRQTILEGKKMNEKEKEDEEWMMNQERD